MGSKEAETIILSTNIYWMSAMCQAMIGRKSFLEIWKYWEEKKKGQYTKENKDTGKMGKLKGIEVVRAV